MRTLGNLISLVLAIVLLVIIGSEEKQGTNSNSEKGSAKVGIQTVSGND